jgi:glycosyltransferase involved in cell wall biosynthesis
MLKTDHKVLFLGHDAGLTGAPLLLLELIKWLKANSTIRTSLLLKRGGEIQAAYQEVTPTHFHCENPGLHWRLLRKLRLARDMRPNLPRLFPVEEYPMIYSNTIDTCGLAMDLAGSGRRIIQHIHELSFMTELFGATDKLQRSIPFTNSYIAASNAVGKYLENNIGIPKEKIHVIHEFPVATTKVGVKIKRKDAIFSQLGIPSESLVVCMCGTPNWRKGADLFVQLAQEVKCKIGTSCYHFVWMGGSVSDQAEALYDVGKLGLGKMCHFIPAVSNPEAYFNAFDIFALTSREDPFPVAMLEAAAIGLPIICFADSGGAPELVENDAGLIVPYLDVRAMAEACIELLSDESRRRKLGGSAKAKVEALYGLNIQGPKILSLIKAAMN